MEQPLLFPSLEAAVPAESLLEFRSDVEFRELASRRALNRYRGGRMPFTYTLNPYRGCEFGCGYCYARYTHEYLGRERQEAWEREILVKTELAQALRAELRPGLLCGQEIAIGTATDPYQPAERRYGVTRSVLEELARHRGLSVSITTKSPLVVRDLDVLRTLDERGELSIQVSLISLDRHLLRRLEPRAPTPERRLWAIERLAAAGLRVGLFLMPILPAIVDRPAALDALVRRAAEAGARFVVPDTLFLRSSARRSFLPIVERDFPDHADRYHRWYHRSAYAPAEYRQRVRRLVRRLARKYGLGGGRTRAEGDAGGGQLALPL
ncbi:MAG TPA: radical SAM protein [Longimicrobiales bacterium]